VIAVVVCLYAFGGKATPGLHIDGLFDLDHADQIARLRAPIGYWNALALVLVMALPIALRVAIDRDRRPGWRLAALIAAFLLLSTTAMTYSRGGVLALAVAMAVLLALGRDRLRMLTAFALAALAAIPVIAIAFGRESLTDSGAPLRDRIADGRSITAMTIVMGAMLIAAAWWLLRAEREGSWTPQRTRTVSRGLALLAAFYLFASVGAAANQPGGLGEQVSRSWHQFIDQKQDKVADPVRLTSTNSGNRWVWWQEAVGSWSDRPFGGWGAGAFPVVHLQYRENTINVAQVHSAELQWLTETGILGFGLAMTGFGLLGFAGVRRVRAAPPGRERELGVALLAAAAAWAVHASIDWDFEIPGATLPFLLFLGVLAATPAETPVEDKVPELFHDPERERGPTTSRVLGVGVATVAACAIAASSLLPWLAVAKTNDAQDDAGVDAPTPEILRAAAAEADVAAQLDPLSPDPLFASYAIALQRGRVVEAREFLLEAAERAPNDYRVWQRLANVALLVADRDGYRQASLRALSLNPRDPRLRRAASRAVAFVAPPGSSATATGTPLPSRQGATAILTSP
ncbi:MAG TPA: O-antigen ligase family protein, partial [Solirubrobacteraceae bacterium]